MTYFADASSRYSVASNCLRGAEEGTTTLFVRMNLLNKDRYGSAINNYKPELLYLDLCNVMFLH